MAEKKEAPKTAEPKAKAPKTVTHNGKEYTVIETHEHGFVAYRGELPATLEFIPKEQ